MLRMSWNEAGKEREMFSWSEQRVGGFHLLVMLPTCFQ